MITISIKIKKEDKPVLAGVAKRMADAVKIQNAETLMQWESFQQVHSKLMSSAYNNSPIRLTLVQLSCFFNVAVAYSQLGAYELANLRIIFKDISKKIDQKLVQYTK